MIDIETIIKKELLKNMEYLDSFCDAHNIQYYLIGGSLLGAIRHSGFIPWDDDLDVAIKRDDYNKLMQLHSEISSDFHLNFYSKNNEYIYPFAKLTSTSVIVEESFYKPVRSGVWIDIFPLDYTFKNKFLRNSQFCIIKLLRKLRILKYGAFKPEDMSGFTFRVAKALHKALKFIPRKLIDIVQDFFQLTIPRIFCCNEMLANYNGTWGAKESAPRKLFSQSQNYDFEGYKFKSVADADYWLTKVYGNYMKLPPKHKRRADHIGKIVFNSTAD